MNVGIDHRRRRGNARRTQRRFRHLSAVVLSLVLSGTAVACGSADDAGDSDKVLTIGLPSGPVSLDPSKDSVTFGNIRPLTNEFLLHQATDGSIQPGLASSWRYVDEAYQVFELTLREGATFSDGSPVDAEAVSTWLEYFSKGAGAFTALMGTVDAVEAVDALTVRLTLAESNPLIPYLLSESANWGAVSSPKAVATPDVLGTETVGAGPYMLDPDQSISDKKYVLVPNPHYDKPDAVKWDRVVVDIIPDANARLQAQSTGQIDVAWGDLTTVAAAEKSGLEVVGRPSGTGGLIFADRAGDGPVGDVRVRQALNYAIDREAITEGLVGENGEPTSQLFATDVESLLRDHYDYDVERAKSLLAEAGYGDGFAVDVLTYGGYGVSGTPLAQAIASYWSKVGVDAKITTAPTAAEYAEKRSSKRYPIVFYSVPTGPMGAGYRMALAPTGGLNPFGATDATMTAIFERASRTNDAQAWSELSQRTVTEAVFVPVFNALRVFYYVSDRVAGVELTEGRPEYSWATEWSPK
ncbi:ABC transporter substrate-binding protein [Nocardioides sp. L-11A]|uniref:ABC transporter substrate-binding protein n=1 Tax=Nocardioides sp. L-11A TaxID=3043848 RepID=UPI00249ADDAE|nr:ABC transporter substrate-binding protein [Nocardioides sp. L-11A]